MSVIAIILIVVLLCGGIGSAPAFGLWGAGAGYGPSGILGVLLIVVLILALTGRF